jgi:hypothetical protein
VLFVATSVSPAAHLQTDQANTTRKLSILNDRP